MLKRTDDSDAGDNVAGEAVASIAVCLALGRAGTGTAGGWRVQQSEPPLAPWPPLPFRKVKPAAWLFLTPVQYADESLTFTHLDAFLFDLPQPWPSYVYILHTC